MSRQMIMGANRHAQPALDSAQLCCYQYHLFQALSRQSWVAYQANPADPSHSEEIMQRYGWWGKYHKFSDEDKPRKIWVGPMSYEEMTEDFDEFRHSFLEHPPNKANAATQADNLVDRDKEVKA